MWSGFVFAYLEEVSCVIIGECEEKYLKINARFKFSAKILHAHLSRVFSFYGFSRCEFFATGQVYECVNVLML